MRTRRGHTAGCFLTVGVFAVLAGCDRPHPPLYVTAPLAAAASVTPPRIEVLQPDLLAIDGRRIRLAGAVTPRPTPEARCAAEALSAHQAQRRMKQLAQGVEIVRVTPTGRSDAEGRPYGQVRFDDSDPASVLIEEGLAVAPADRTFDWCGPLSEALPQAQHIAVLSWRG